MNTAHKNTDVSDAEWNINPLSLERETGHVTDFSLALTITTLKKKIGCKIYFENQNFHTENASKSCKKMNELIN